MRLRSLKIKIISSQIILIILASLLIGLPLFLNSKKKIIEEAEHDLALVLLKESAELRHNLNENILLFNFFVRQAEWNNFSWELTDQQKQVNFLQKSSASFSGIIQTDEEGKIILIQGDLPGYKTGESVAHLSIFNQAIKQPQNVVNSLEQGADKNLILYFAKRYTHFPSSQNQVLLGMVSFEKMVNLVSSDIPGRKNYQYIPTIYANKKGEIIFSENKINPGGEIPVESFLTKKENYLFIGGKNYLAQSHYQESLGINIIALLPQEIIRAEIKEIKIIFIAFTLLTLLIGIVLSMKFSEYIIRPLKDLAGSVKEISTSRNFSQRIKEDQRKDEVQDLIHGFNEMSAHLEESYKGLEDVVNKRTKRLQALFTINQMVTMSYNLTDIFDTIILELKGIIEFDRASIIISEPDGKNLRVAEKYPLQTLPAKGTVLPKENTAAGWVIDHQECFIEDPTKTAFRENDILIKEGVRSLLICPLITEKNIIGVFVLSSKKSDLYQERDKKDLAQISSLIALALEKIHLFEEVSRAKNVWEDTFDAMDNLISIQDLDFKITRVNQVLAHRLGVSPQDLIGKKCYEIYYENTVSCPQCLGLSSMKNLKLAKKEINNLKIKGDFLMATNPLFDEKHNLYGVLHVLVDITENKRLTTLLLQSQKLEEIGIMASGVAHEINNPLTGILGFSEALLKKETDPAMEKHYLTIINKEAKRAAQIIHNLLTFSHQDRSEKTQIDLNEVVTSIVELKNYQLFHENITLELELKKDLPMFKGNFNQLQQVLLNIIDNAHHSIRDSKKGDKIIIQTGIENDHIFISIKDNGPGMDEKTKHRAFDPFFSTKETGKGTGLGLFVSYNIIRQHYGKIILESETGIGTTIWLKFPINSDEENNEIYNPFITKET